MVEIQSGRRGKGEGGAAAGLQPDARHAGQLGDVVGPGTGGVDQYVGAPVLAASRHQPAPVHAPDRTDLGICADTATGLVQAVQIALVQRMGVDIGGIGIENAAQHPLWPQHRHQRADFGRAQQLQLRRAFAQGLPLLCQLVFVAGGGHQHAAARLQQRMFGKAGWRLLQERPAGTRQCAHLGIAVALHEHGGGATGGMVSGL